jgi:hypothetical protein
VLLCKDRAMSKSSAFDRDRSSSERSDFGAFRIERSTMMTKDNLSSVRSLLKNTSPGPIEDQLKHTIMLLLAGCWDELEGVNETGMKAWKLDRAEDVSWNPPVLSFTIERHGATVLGSSRAELHRWSVNLEEATADCAQGSYRQIWRTAPRLDVKPIVARVCEAVQLGPESDCDLVKQGVIEWKGDDLVSVKHGMLISGGGYQQTVQGRRRRFRNQLEERMLSIGWRLETVQRSMTFRKM